MKIVLNGREYETKAQDVATLLREQNAPNKGVAVAVNGQVAPRAQHAATLLRESDQVEIIRAVQGG